jgi:hypothetical protein
MGEGGWGVPSPLRLGLHATAAHASQGRRAPRTSGTSAWLRLGPGDTQTVEPLSARVAWGHGGEAKGMLVFPTRRHTRAPLTHSMPPPPDAAAGQRRPGRHRAHAGDAREAAGDVRRAAAARGGLARRRRLTHAGCSQACVPMPAVAGHLYASPRETLVAWLRPSGLGLTGESLGRGWSRACQRRQANAAHGSKAAATHTRLA